MKAISFLILTFLSLNVDAQLRIFPFYESETYGLEKKNGKVVLEQKYAAIDYLTKGDIFRYTSSLEQVHWGEESIFIPLYGYVSQKGKVLPCVYRGAMILGNTIVLADSLGRYFKTDKSLKTLERLEAEVVGIVEDHFLVVRNNKAGVYNAKWEPVLPIEYEFIGPYENMLFYLDEAESRFFPQEETATFPLVVIKDEKIGLFRNGKIIVQPGLSSWKPLENGYARFGKNGLYGLMEIKNGKIILPAEYKEVDVISGYGHEAFIRVKNDSVQAIYTKSMKRIDLDPTYDYISVGSDYTLVGRQKKYGLLGSDFSEVLPAEYNRIEYVYGISKGMRLIKNDKQGLFSTVQGRIVVPIEYDTLYPAFYRDYILTKKGNQYGLINEKTFEVVLENQFDYVDLHSDTDTLVVIRNGVKGFYVIPEKRFADVPQIAGRYKLKWQTYVGITTYRSNITSDNGSLYIGSNGADRNSNKDPFDGVYRLDAKTGKVLKRYRSAVEGDNDVNGVAVAGERLYFGNDNKQFFCFSSDGELLWERATRGDTEGCPALADLNADGAKDVVFITEGYGVTALDGLTGDIIWKCQHQINSGRMLTSPALFDINGDGIADVIAAADGVVVDSLFDEEQLDNPFAYNDVYASVWAIDGKTGNYIWTLSDMGVRFFASPIIDARTRRILVANLEGDAFSIDFSGKVRETADLSYNVFSTPIPMPDHKTLLGGISDPRGYHGGIVYEELKSANAEEQQTTNRFVRVGGRVSATPIVADLGKGMFAFLPGEQGDLIVFNASTRKVEVLGLPAGSEASCYIRDIDGDGKLELIIAGLDGYLRCYETGSGGTVYWGSFRGDDNSGVLR